MIFTTNQEYLKLKSEILSEITATIEEHLKPLSEALKNFIIPNTFKDDLERNALGLRIFRKDNILERDSLGVCKAKRKEILRDSFGQVKRVAIFKG